MKYRRIHIGVAALATMLVSTFSVPTLAQAATVNEMEDNGGQSVAQSINLGDQVNGTAGNNGATATQDYDFYSFSVTQGGKLNLGFTFDQVSGTVKAFNVQIQKPAANQGYITVVYSFDVKANEYAGTWLNDRVLSLPAGSYWVQVLADTTSPAWGKNYKLSVSMTTSGGYEVEDNNSTSTATALTLGTACSAESYVYATSGDPTDADYFRFQLPNAGKVNLAFTPPSGLSGTGKAYDISVVNTAGNVLFDYDVLNNGTGLSGMDMYLGAATYYVRIDGKSSQASWGKKYTLTVSLSTQSGYDYETELNHEKTTADALTFDKPLLGSSNGLLTPDSSDTALSSPMDLDYFQATAPKSGKLNISFTYPVGTATDQAYRLQVLVYPSNSTTLTSSWTFDFNQLTGDKGNGTWLLSQPTTVKSGDQIYLRVTSDSTHYGWGKTYTLKLSIDAAAWEAEQNYQTSNATALTLGQLTKGAAAYDYNTCGNSAPCDVDLYSFAVTSVGQYKVNLTFPQVTAAADAYQVSVSNSAGTVLKVFNLKGSDYNGAWSASNQVIINATGTYYVQVMAYKTYPTYNLIYQIGVEKTASGNDPQGGINNVEARPGAVWVRGWAADKDAPTTPIQVKVSIGGTLGASGAETYTLNANLQRTDIPRTYPEFGEMHGFNSTITTAKRGSQTIYFYAVNASGTAGSDKLLGSRTVTIGVDPQGAINNIEGRSGAIWVRGWAADKDAPTTALQVKVSIGGELGASGAETVTLNANLQRTDIPRTYPEFGELHGYNSTITTAKRGNVVVYFYAVNAPGTGGSDKLLGSRTVLVGVDPQGAINNIEARPGGIWVRGWAADADAPTTALQVKVSIGGPITASGVDVKTLNANLQRTDIPRTYPAFGEMHGYNSTLTTTKRGSQQVYFYAVNASGTGGADKLLGTRTITITN